MEYKGQSLSGRDIATVELLEEIKAYFSEDGAALNALALGGVSATSYALKADVDKSIADLVGAAPEALDTLYEISAVLQENVADIDTILTQIGTKANQTDLDEAIRRISTLENTTPTISSIMGSDPIGNTSSFIYWNGSGWKTQEINKGLVGLGNVENTKLSTWGGSQNLATLGTVTSGTWEAGTIDVAHGGTGRTSLTSGSALVGNGAGAVSLRAITSSVSSGSTSLITSGGVYSALSSYRLKSNSTFGTEIILGQGAKLYVTDYETTPNSLIALQFSSDGYLLLGQQTAREGYPTIIYGESIIFSHTGGLKANTAMTIGVDGDITIEGNLIVKGTVASGGKGTAGAVAGSLTGDILPASNYTYNIGAVDQYYKYIMGNVFYAGASGNNLNLVCGTSKDIRFGYSANPANGSTYFGTWGKTNGLVVSTNMSLDSGKTLTIGDVTLSASGGKLYANGVAIN